MEATSYETPSPTDAWLWLDIQWLWAPIRHTCTGENEAIRNIYHTRDISFLIVSKSREDTQQRRIHNKQITLNRLHFLAMLNENGEKKLFCNTFKLNEEVMNSELKLGQHNVPFVYSPMEMNRQNALNGSRSCIAYDMIFRITAAIDIEP